MVERIEWQSCGRGFDPAVGVIFLTITTEYYIYHNYYDNSVDSSMVRIRAFQARGPGSIPGRRIYNNNYYCNTLRARNGPVV